MPRERRMRPTRVAWVQHEHPSTFTELDRRLLGDTFEIEPLPYPGRITMRWCWQSFRAVRRADAVYAFFASEHAAVPFAIGRLLRRRLILVPAGYDYAYLPERRYGLRANRRGWLPWLLGSWADVALPISEQTRSEFLDLVPLAAGRTELAYLPVDPAEWLSPEVDRLPDRAVTFGYIDEEAFGRKGIDRFVALARADPEREYVLGGTIAPEVLARIGRERPPNLKLTGFLSHEELRRLLWSSSVYIQLSWHETFGVAMAEAMLCGCVPLISESPALNEVAGRWAVVSADPSEDCSRVNDAFERARTMSRADMVEDVARRFSLDQRRAQLSRAILGPSERRAPRNRGVRAGWSRTRLPIAPDMRVLDLGSGAFPNPRADVLCDGELVDDRHRAGLPIVIDRPMVVADAGALPFRVGAFDWVIASHIAEHLPDPASFCAELSRVAKCGFIETPSPLADVLLHEDYHLWRVGRRRGAIRFRWKAPRSRLTAALTWPFYVVLNAGQQSCERPVLRLPGGPLGWLARTALRVVNGTLARVGVLHTRVVFSPSQPLAWQVIER